ncbi:hypothetical protein I350_05196 [Cryptococcus amylolentus CBS 6273]|nr:hypothetical protein I350_05196 [Cryptococcus amylolentus CBS 6273]
MPASLYLRPSPRAFFLLTPKHALVFRQPSASEASASKSVVVAEWLPLEEVETQDLIKIHGGVDGVLGVGSVPSAERSPVPEIFLFISTNSTPLPPLLPNSPLRPSKLLSVQFHSLSSSAWDPPDWTSLANAARAEQMGLDWEDEYENVSATWNAAGGSTTPSSQYPHPCLGMKKYLESGGFFFAEGCKWDISSRLSPTSNWIKEASSSPSDRVGGHPLEGFDERFVWNKSLLEPFLEFRKGLGEDMRRELDNAALLIPIIQGFCGALPISPSSSSSSSLSSLALISRLSWKRAGARFRTRGIDDDGQVANFVESELIYSSGEMTMSYVQVRGSVPVFWGQPVGGLGTLNQKVEITRPAQATQPAFDKHFLELLEHYNSIHAVNLLGQKDAESMLSNAYSSHLSSLKRTLQDTPSEEKDRADIADRGTLELTAYDFHSAVRSGGNEAVRYDLDRRLREVVRSREKFGWTVVDMGSGDVIEQQQGVFRTNCLDCLDRTNYVQDVISSLTLSAFLETYVSPTLASSPTLWSAHRSLWADNGDRLSKIYAGTGAINTSATRSGKKTFAGLLSDATKSVGRAYVNNFQDKGKQMAIDLLLGMMVGQRRVVLWDPVSESVQAALIQREGEYTSHRHVSIFSGTWNLNGKAPNEPLDPWLFPPDTADPDIYMIAFQEIVELTAGQILQTDPAKRRMWEKYIMDTFNNRKPSQYLLLRSDQLVGTAIIIIVKSPLLPHIRRIESATKKTGLSGLSGNKGGVSVRFELFDTSICLVTCHLAAGFGNVQDRNADWRTVVKGLRFQRGRGIEDHEIAIWGADFNYRISMANQEVRDLVERGDLHRLLESDQLLGAMENGDVFGGYDEGPVTFPPTYKYDNGTSNYDSSEKQRVPAWTDRILFKGAALRLKEYSRSELMTSDHRPVYAVFDATIREVDHVKRDGIAKELVHGFVREGGSQKLEGIVGVEVGEKSARETTRGLAKIDRATSRPSPRLPPRPSSSTSLNSLAEKASPTLATGRISSVHNLQAPPHTSASNSLRALATSRASGSEGLNGQRRTPPIPPRPSVSPRPPTASTTKPKQVPAPPRSRSVSNLSNHTESSISPVSPTTTGEFVVVPSSTNGAARRAPPLPPRVNSVSQSASHPPPAPSAAAAKATPRSAPPVPRKSLDLNGSPPSGLMSPVDPDVVMQKIKAGMGTPVSRPIPARPQVERGEGSVVSMVRALNANNEGGGWKAKEKGKVEGKTPGESVKEPESSTSGLERDVRDAVGGDVFGKTEAAAKKKPPPAVPKKPVTLQKASDPASGETR